MEKDFLMSRMDQVLRERGRIVPTCLHIDAARLNCSIDEHLKGFFSEELALVNKSISIIALLTTLNKRQISSLTSEFFQRLKFVIELDILQQTDNVITIKESCVEFVGSFIRNFPEMFNLIVENEIVQSLIYILPSVDLSIILSLIYKMHPDFISSLGTLDCINFLLYQLVENDGNNVGLQRIYSVISYFFRVEIIPLEVASQFLPHIVGKYVSYEGSLIEPIGNICNSCRNNDYLEILSKTELITLVIKTYTLISLDEKKSMIKILLNFSRSPYASILIQANIFYYLYAWCMGSYDDFFEITALYSCKIVESLIRTNNKCISELVASTFISYIPILFSRIKSFTNTKTYLKFIKILIDFAELNHILNSLELDGLYLVILDSNDAQQILLLLEMFLKVRLVELSTPEHSTFYMSLCKFFNDDLSISYFDDILASGNEQLSELLNQLMAHFIDDCKS